MKQTYTLSNKTKVLKCNNENVYCVYTQRHSCGLNCAGFELMPADCDRPEPIALLHCLSARGRAIVLKEVIE